MNDKGNRDHLFSYLAYFRATKKSLRSGLCLIVELPWRRWIMSPCGKEPVRWTVPASAHPGSLWWIPCWAFWEYPQREKHSLCHPRIQIQGVLVNRVSEMPPKEQHVPSQRNRRLEHLRRENGDGSIWGNSKAVLTSHSYHTQHVANLNLN